MNTHIAQWKTNTPALLAEIMSNNGMTALYRPLQIFGRMLAEVADEAARINDPELNAVMMRLALYEVGDPYSDEYDADLVSETIEKARAIKAAR